MQLLSPAPLSTSFRKTSLLCTLSHSPSLWWKRGKGSSRCPHRVCGEEGVSAVGISARAGDCSRLERTGKGGVPKRAREGQKIISFFSGALFSLSLSLTLLSHFLELLAAP